MKCSKWMGILILAATGLTACGGGPVQNSPSNDGKPLNSVMKPTLLPDEAFAKGQQAEKTKNLKDAVNYYRQAAEQGHVKAQIRLGWLYFLKREGVNQDSVESTKWFRKAAENGDAGAQGGLGDAYYYGRGIGKNLAEAIKWYRKASEHGNANAQYSLGWMYHHGQGVKKNIPEAIKWLETAANDQLYSKLSFDGGPSNSARIELAAIYAKGDGVTKDAKKAFQLQKQAADHGSTQALAQVAYRYYVGNGAVKNLPSAIRLFSKAIEKNDKLPLAKVRLLFAKFEALSDGKKAYEKKQYKKAYDLLIAVAEEKDAEAQYWVGRMHWDGKGPPLINRSEAITWWKKAAGQGQIQAIEALGEAYWNGFWVSKDKSKAIKYLLLSASPKNKAAVFLEKYVFPGWDYVAEGNKDIIFINKNRINQDGALRWFWSKWVPVPKSVNSTYFLSKYSNQYSVANCASRMLSTKSHIDYNADVVLKSYDWPITKNSFSPVVPNSLGEAQLNSVCSGLVKKAKRKNPPKQIANVVSGTGWPVAGGYVVTNHHVVAGRKTIVLLRMDGTKIPASVAVDDATNDLALLKPKNSKLLPPALPLANRAAQVGGHVFTVGYPHPDMMGKEPKLTEGIINARTGIKNDPRVYQISVPLQGGNSGGPLLNMNGEVVGVTTSKMSAVKVFKWTGDLPQNVNYAVKVGYVRALLSSVDPAASVPVLPSKKDDLAGLAKRIEGSVLMVIAQ